jgi:hypothetical protein
MAAKMAVGAFSCASIAFYSARLRRQNYPSGRSPA